MGVKRKSEHVHPSRQGQVPAEPSQKRIKRHTIDGKPFKKKSHPVNELKSQIRSLKRLLSRNEKLPADVRVEKERELQTAQRELDAADRARTRSDMIGRYHKIRFFDRQKAMKRLKHARKELAAFDESGGDAQERVVLAKRVEDANVDVNYTQYYPLDRHYASLFPRKRTVQNDKGNEDEEVEGDDPPAGAGNATLRKREGDSEMWQQIKQSMADGTLDALRNGKLLPLEPPHDSTKSNNARVKAGQAVAEKTRKDTTTDPGQSTISDEDSDGGFFE